MVKRRRPEETLQRIKGVRPSNSDTDAHGRIDKKVTTLSVVSAEEKEAETGGLLSPSLFVPTEEQLEKINNFTLRRVSADEVACFTTHSMNDVPDRDDDVFNTNAVKGFAKLPPPYSPTGKSFMVSHDTSKLAVGRLFDTRNKGFDYENEKHTMLANDVYIPRIAANESFIQNMEFGVNWAVSVGVMLGKGTCLVGEPHDWGWCPWWCSEGHEKGYWYDPQSEEKDSWDWPLPVPEGTKGSVKTLRDMDDAKDMYELSMVYLGAQYMASVMDKDPTLTGIVKGAHLPVIGLRREEAKSFHFPELPSRAREAAKSHKITEDEGTFRWVDADNLIWCFTPGEDADPLLIGKKAEVMDRSETNTKVQTIKSKLAKARSEKDTDAVGALASQLDGLLTEIDDALDQGDLDGANPLVDQAQTIMDQIFDSLYEEDDPDDDNKDAGEWGENDEGKKPQGDAMSKKAVMAAMEHFKLPETVTRAVAEASDEPNAALDALVKGIHNEIQRLTPLAKSGEQYVKDLRVEVLDWYRKAHEDPKSPGVDVSHIERLLDSVGGNIEVMRSLVADYRAHAQSRFGNAVRRSTVESDPNNPSGKGAEDQIADIETRFDPKRVSRIHG